MNPTIKREWVDELRSGKYVQGRTVLRGNDDSFCCLGVLCDMAVRAGVVVAHHVEGESWAYGEDPDHSLLPAEVMAWADLDHDPEVEFDSEVVVETICLSALNDQGEPFDDIADMIEDQL